MESAEVRILSQHTPGVVVTFLRREASFGVPATAGSSGHDLISCEPRFWLRPRVISRIRTGVRLEIPRGYEGQVRSRSWHASRGIVVANSPGTIDSDYRGEIIVLLQNVSEYHWEEVKPGDRIAQLVFAPVALPSLTFQKFVDADKQPENLERLVANEEPHEEVRIMERGDKGFGSTGK